MVSDGRSLRLNAKHKRGEERTVVRGGKGWFSVYVRSVFRTSHDLEGVCSRGGRGEQ